MENQHPINREKEPLTMPQTPYRTPQDAHTDILAKIGLLDTQEAPMCGTEEY